MKLPSPRGSLTEELIAALRENERVSRSAAPSDHEDLQLALWILYELHYRGFVSVDDRREWDPELLGLRMGLEEEFEGDLRSECRTIVALADGQPSVPDKLTAITAYEPEFSLPLFLQRDATVEQYLELLIQRSLYHLKESDPHAWVVPRLDGPAKVALAELQYDEFGAGRPERLHSKLYGDALDSCGLDSAYGAYVDRVTVDTLAVNNAMSLFGLHRRLRGAAMGHLAAFEMTSSLPCRRYLQGAQRLGLGGAVEHYFDEHVEADAVHEQLAARNICGALVEAEPDLEDDVLFGAAACVWLDAVAGSRMIEAWEQSRSALREPAALEVA